MEQVAVIHTAFEDAPSTVAFVDVDENLSLSEKLEYAYRWTNNVMGSWSRTDLEDNGDYNPAVTRVAPLHKDGMVQRYAYSSLSIKDKLSSTSTNATVEGLSSNAVCITATFSISLSIKII